jgi:hypothetical protein
MMCVCRYVRMCVRTYARIYVCMYVCMYVWCVYVGIYVCMYILYSICIMCVCIYLCMYSIRIYVCFHARAYVLIICRYTRKTYTDNIVNYGISWWTIGQVYLIIISKRRRETLYQINNVLNLQMTWGTLRQYVVKPWLLKYLWCKDGLLQSQNTILWHWEA